MPATFVKALGRGSSLVGTAQLLIGLGLACGMFFSAYILAPRRQKRGVIYWAHTTCALVYGLMALGMYVFDEPNSGITLTALYLVAVFVYFLAIGMAIPIWLSIVGDLFPEAQRARVLAIAFMANRIGGIAGGWWAERALLHHENVPQTWGLLFMAAAICGAVGSLPFLALVERGRTPKTRPRLAAHAGKLLSTLSESRAIRRFLLVDLLGVASFIVIVYFGDAAMRRDGIAESWSGRFVQYAAIGQLAICGLIAVGGHWMSMRRWLALSFALMVVAALLSARGGGPLPYSIVAAFGGVFMGLRLSFHSPEVMRLDGNVEDQTLALSAVGTCITATQGAMPFLAGLALAHCTYEALFLAVAAIVLLAALMLLTWVPRLPRPVSGPSEGTSSYSPSSSRG